MSTEKFIKREKMSINKEGFISFDDVRVSDWSQASERDNAPRMHSAFWSEGWGGV